MINFFVSFCEDGKQIRTVFLKILPLLTLATLNLDNGNLGFVGDHKGGYITEDQYGYFCLVLLYIGSKRFWTLTKLFGHGPK